MDEWLRHYATQNRRRNITGTWVIADDNFTIAGYLTLSMTGIDASAAPSIIGKGTPGIIPALLLGRLAVDSKYAGQGIGTALVKHVLALAVGLNAQAACRAVVVNALNQDSLAFWVHLGFHQFNQDDPDNLDLFLLTGEMQQTMAALSSPLNAPETRIP